MHSHGVLRVPEYVRKLAGGVDPQGRPAVERQVGACLVVDGGNSMGQIGAHFAMRRAIEVAGGSLGAPGVLPGRGSPPPPWGSNHCGAMAYYAMQALPADMIGLATTNAPPTMAPWGARSACWGSTPWPWPSPPEKSCPSSTTPPSATAHGKVRFTARRDWTSPRDGPRTGTGAPPPTPRAASGRPCSPSGASGTALALLMGLLSSMPSGAAYGTELGSMEDGPRPGQDGYFLLAISVAAFEDVARFKARVDGAVRQLRGARKAPDTERIYAPGELEFETAARYDREGVPLNQETLGDLAATARACGVDPAP